MKPEKQRIAIAEACGWIKAWEPAGGYDGVGCWMWHHGRQNLHFPPEYLSDLNAMHEAEEKVLFVEDAPELLGNYHAALISVMDCKNTTWRRIHATAAQRAEAFLRTLGKWEEEKP